MPMTIHIVDVGGGDLTDRMGNREPAIVTPAPPADPRYPDVHLEQIGSPWDNWVRLTPRLGVQPAPGWWFSVHAPSYQPRLQHPYVEGMHEIRLARTPLPPPQVPCRTPHEITWDHLIHRRQLQDDQDEVGIWCPFSSWGGFTIGLRSTRRDLWWKGVSLCDPLTGVILRDVVTTDAAGGRPYGFVRVSHPAMQRLEPHIPMRSDWRPQLLPGNVPDVTLILSKAKSLGAETPMYRLRLRDAPIDLRNRYVEFQWHQDRPT